MSPAASTARLSLTGCMSGNGHLHARVQQALARPLPGCTASVPSMEAGVFFLASGQAPPSAPGASIGYRHRNLIRTGVRKFGDRGCGTLLLYSSLGPGLKISNYVSDQWS